MPSKSKPNHRLFLAHLLYYSLVGLGSILYFAVMIAGAFALAWGGVLLLDKYFG
jgi:hypothetical protein